MTCLPSGAREGSTTEAIDVRTQFCGLVTPFFQSPTQMWCISGVDGRREASIPA